jgi:hypothetical protein
MGGSPVLGDLGWLSAFNSDWAKLVAVGIVAVAVIVVSCGRKAMQVWADDRLDRRAHERKKQAMATAVAEKIEERKAQRLDLDV